MNRMIALVLIVVGATLLVFGYDASKSFGSEVSKAFTGEMSDRALNARTRPRFAEVLE